MEIDYYKKYEPIFGSWRIVREIGAGSYGKVFEIEREDFGYTYKAALKAVTIPQSSAEVENIMDDGMDAQSITAYFRGFVEELLSEFRIMSKLKGESNVVSCEDYIVVPHTDGIGWDILMRMELLTPLRQFSRANPFGRDEIIKLGIDICRALELCRNQNIIHRDIKPENIFVSDSGRFKLGDFGIARTVEKTSGGLSKKGTYTYMAPEVYRGEEYGASVDIYSLGMVLYRYANSNREPFLPPAPAPVTYSARSAALERRMRGDALPAPANSDPALTEVILKACSYDPHGRYSSPTEMRRALEAIVFAAQPETVEPFEEEEDTVYIKDIETEKEAVAAGAPTAFGQDDAYETVMFGIDASDETISFDEEPADETVVFAEDKTTLLGGDTTQEQSAQNSGIETNQTYYAAEPPRPVFEEEKPRKKGSVNFLAIAVIFALLALLAAFALFLPPDNGWDIWHGKYYADGEALTGWQEIDNNWYYFDDSGAKQTGWLELDAGKYYMNKDGTMATGWVSVEGNLYYFAKDSGIQCFGWLQLGDAWYYLAPSEGNAMAVGKWEVGQDHYYFDGNGVMQTGTVELNGANYVFGDDGRFLRREYLNGDLMDYDFVNVYGIN